MAETVKKPTSNRSAKERRNTLFRVLDGVLSLSHQKIHAGGQQRQSKAGLGKSCGFSRLNLRQLAQGRGVGVSGVSVGGAAKEQHTDTEIRG